MTRTARQKAIRKSRRDGLAPREGCPHPAKRAYESETAVSHALRGSRRTGLPIRIYECPCGALHLTRQKKFKPQKKAA